jgi:hypothetical protein
VRAVEENLTQRGAPFSVVRATFEFLRPLVMDPCSLSLTSIRQGKTAETWEVVLSSQGKPLVRALVLALVSLSGLPRVEHPGPSLPSANESAPFRFPFRWDRVSYADGIETRWARGSVGSGEAAAWMRPVIPLVEGEEMSPVQRLALLVDAANGVSAPLPYDTFTFVNPDLTLALLRPPCGEWICIDSRSSVEEHGVGLVDARLSDEAGYLGRSLQTLVVRAR